MGPVLAVLACLLAPGSALTAAQDQYENLPFTPYEFYEGLLAHVRDGDFGSLEHDLDGAAGLFKALREGLGTDAESPLREAVRSRESDAAARAARKLIFTDMRFNFVCARGLSKGPRRERILRAFTGYEFLSDFVRAWDPPLDREVRKLFRGVYRIEEPAEFSRRTSLLLELLSPHFP